MSCPRMARRVRGHPGEDCHPRDEEFLPPPRGATKGGGAGWQRWEGQRRSRCQSLHPGATERKRGQGQAATAPTEPSGHSRTLRQHPPSSAGSVPFPPGHAAVPSPRSLPRAPGGESKKRWPPGAPGDRHLWHPRDAPSSHRSIRFLRSARQGRGQRHFPAQRGSPRTRQRRAPR